MFMSRCLTNEIAVGLWVGYKLLNCLPLYSGVYLIAIMKLNNHVT